MSSAITPMWEWSSTIVSYSILTISLFDLFATYKEDKPSRKPRTWTFFDDPLGNSLTFFYSWSWEQVRAKSICRSRSSIKLWLIELQPRLLGIDELVVEDRNSHIYPYVDKVHIAEKHGGFIQSKLLIIYGVSSSFTMLWDQIFQICWWWRFTGGFSKSKLFIIGGVSSSCDNALRLNILNMLMMKIYIATLRP